MLLIVKRTIVIRQSLILDEQFQDQERPKDRNCQHYDGIPVGATVSIPFLSGIILLIIFRQMTYNGCNNITPDNDCQANPRTMRYKEQPQYQ